MLLAILALISLIGESQQIVGGRPAKEGQFPWAVALFKDNLFICTASIIGENTILTAAHCVSNNGQKQPADSYHGIANLKKTSLTVRIEFKDIVVHPDYSESGIQNDIAVMITTEPVPFSDTVQPICIANDTSSEYRDVIAMGWGDTSRTRIVPISPENLHFAVQTVASNSACSKVSFERELEDSKLCAGNLFSGICNGDSGGPLVDLKGDVPIQVGVASFGNAITGCGALTPAVWTRVSSYTDFITENASPGELCYEL